MKKTLFALTILAGLCASHSYSQTVPGVIFSYDGSGKRIKREMGLVLPKQGGNQDSSAIDNPASTFKDDNLVLEAYPNPTNTDLTITNLTWKQDDKAVVTVCDIQGKEITRQQFTQARDVVPFMKFTPGTYVVHYILNDKSANAWRIIKL
jgi:hypothetical protein